MAYEMMPKLRGVQMTQEHEYGASVVVLSDPMGITERAVAFPRNLLPLLELCDGTRDLPTLRTAMELRTGVKLGPEYIEKLMAVLDEALLLESDRFAEVYAETLEAYRAAPARAPVMMGTVYQENPRWVERALKEYFDALPQDTVHQPVVGVVRGLVSPHIDYQRGGTVYAGVWQKAAEAARTAEVVVILGTNHCYGERLITLTRQSYATPWGVLRTASDIVEDVAGELGEDSVFAEELSHRREHSVEAAAVWLHYLTKDSDCEIVPVLCGSFHRFIQDRFDPAQDEDLSLFIDALRAATSGRRTLVVAAGDLAHVGPAFGDREGVSDQDRERLESSDRELVEAIANGDADGLFSLVRRDGDRDRICGLSPIYIALRLLGDVSGEVTGYAQCPADTTATSYVSICGVILG
jgi:hypothetical protein